MEGKNKSYVPINVNLGPKTFFLSKNLLHLALLNRINHYLK